NGRITAITKDPLYSEIGEVMAKRTYDQAGNYTVRPFRLHIQEDDFDPETYATAVLSPGLAYVHGYSFETVSDTDIQVPKARTTENVESLIYNLNYGNYVIVQGIHGLFDYSNNSLIDIHCVPSAFINKTSAGAYAQTKIGYARTNYISYYGDGGNSANVWNREYEFYIMDTHFTAITSNANTVT